MRLYDCWAEGFLYELTACGTLSVNLSVYDLRSNYRRLTANNLKG